MGPMPDVTRDNGTAQTTAQSTAQTKPKPGKRATRADVAKLAGVSTAVVSYVFNNGPRPVATATKARVLKAAEQLGYRPNSMARALSTGKSRTLGVIVPDLSNPFFASVYGALETEAADHGYSTLFMASHQDPKLERDRVARLIDHEVDAMVVASAMDTAQLPSIVRNDCPFVFLDQFTPVPGAKCVATDFRKAVADGTAHLIGHGYERIIMFSGKAEEGLDDRRIQGWYQAHEEAGRMPGPIVPAHFTRQGGYEAAMSLLDSGADGRSGLPDAIFVDSDLQAIGALSALYERHVRVPEDIAVASFDGTIEAQFSCPPLTTVEQDTDRLAKLVFHAATHPGETPDFQLIDAHLTIRRSCGCNG